MEPNWVGKGSNCNNKPTWQRCGRRDLEKHDDNEDDDEEQGC